MLPEQPHPFTAVWCSQNSPTHSLLFGAPRTAPPIHCCLVLPEQPHPFTAVWCSQNSPTHSLLLDHISTTTWYSKDSSSTHLASLSKGTTPPTFPQNPVSRCNAVNRIQSVLLCHCDRVSGNSNVSSHDTTAGAHARSSQIPRHLVDVTRITRTH